MQSRRDVQRQQSRRSFKKTVRNIVVTLLLVILVTWSVYAVANHPRAAAQKQATAMAKKYAGLKSTSGFYIYNRDQTYYTVAGKNAKGQTILVVVPQKGGDIRVLKQSAGLTASQAKSEVKTADNPKRVLKVAMGIFNNKPVWEVTYLNQKGNLCYDLISFTSGKSIQQINNL